MYKRYNLAGARVPLLGACPPSLSLTGPTLQLKTAVQVRREAVDKTRNRIPRLVDAEESNDRNGAGARTGDRKAGVSREHKTLSSQEAENAWKWVL